MAKWNVPGKEEIDCELELSASLLSVRAEGRENLVFPLERFKIQDFGYELRLSLPDGQEILIFDEALQKRIKKFKSRKGKLAITNKITNFGVIYKVLGILVTLSVLAYGFAPMAAKFIPVSWENALGDKIREFLPGETCAPDLVKKHTDSLITRFGYAEQIKDYKIEIVKSDTVNALALPGGRILVYSGLLQKMKDPDAFAAVLAHEIAHQQERHFATGIARALLLSGVWNLVLGDLTGVMFLDPVTLMAIIDRGYSRSQETVADEIAAEMLNHGNVALGAGARFLDLLSKESGEIPEFLSTHPLSGRGEHFNSFEGPAKALHKKAMSAEDWKQLKVFCK